MAEKVSSAAPAKQASLRPPVDSAPKVEVTNKEAAVQEVRHLTPQEAQAYTANEVKKVEARYNQDMQELKERIKKLEPLASISDIPEEQRVALLERSQMAQDDADYLGDKFGLTQRQVSVLARILDRKERRAMAEDMKPTESAETLKAAQNKMEGSLAASTEPYLDLGNSGAGGIAQLTEKELIRRMSDGEEYDPKAASALLRKMGIRNV